MRKCDLKIPSEALVCSAQELATRTNYPKYYIDKSVNSPSCRIRGETGETISHFVRKCSKLTQREYKKRHDNVARMVHWELCQGFILEKPENGIYTIPKLLVEMLTTSIIWDMNIQCDSIIVERKPDIVIVNKMEKTAVSIDVTIPWDKKITDKEKEKIEKYQNLKRETQRLDVILVVLGALGSVTKNSEKYVDKIGIKIDLHTIQKATLLGTVRILRKVPEC